MLLTNSVSTSISTILVGLEVLDVGCELFGVHVGGGEGDDTRDGVGDDTPTGATHAADFNSTPA